MNARSSQRKGCTVQYFFHIRHHEAVIEDLEGTDLVDADMARQEAVQCARDIIAERIRTGTPLHMDTTLDVRDAEDRVVVLLSFASVLFAGLAPPDPALGGRRHSPIIVRGDLHKMSH